MNLLLIGNHAGWMATHLDHFAEGFRALGCTVRIADYHQMERWHDLPLPRSMRDERRQRSLEQLVKTFAPDVCFFAGSLKFDLPRLKSFWHGAVFFHDYDGPRRNVPEDFREISRNCLFLTASRYIQRSLHELGERAFYLPHGVNTDYYDPWFGGEQRFPAVCSYIGRATPRREAICATLKSDIALYGDRWKYTSLADCCRMRRDVKERELVAIYRDSGFVLNILQEPLQEFRTILSLQCFAVPSTAGCLCAEYVEELPEAFEEGREVLSFRSPDEVAEISARLRREPGLAEKIGEAGRRRCLAEHTHMHRAKAILRLLD